MTKFVCLLFLIAPLTFAFAGDRPAVTAQEAAKIADDYLKDRGLAESTFIESITLEKVAMFSPERHWFVKWDAPLPVDGMQKKEIGLKVTMAGKATRLIE
jgi:malate synthase